MNSKVNPKKHKPSFLWRHVLNRTSSLKSISGEASRLTRKTPPIVNESSAFQSQDCGAGTQISGSSSRHLIFFAPFPAPAQHLEVSGSRMIWSIENWKPLYYLYNPLAPQTMSVEPEPKFQASAIQNCLGSDFTALVVRVILSKISSVFRYKSTTTLMFTVSISSWTALRRKLTVD